MASKANHQPRELLVEHHTTAPALSSVGLGWFCSLRSPFLLFATGVEQSSSSVCLWRPPQGCLCLPGKASQRMGRGGRWWQCLGCLEKAGKSFTKNCLHGSSVSFTAWDLCWVLGSPVVLLPPAESPLGTAGGALCPPLVCSCQHPQS